MAHERWSMTEQLAREGIEALRRGDGPTARARFEAYSKAVGDANTPWLMLAQAYRLTGDDRAEEGALGKLLMAEPRNLAALLMMGDVKARLKDDRAATGFYQTALNVASATPNIAQPLQTMLGKAQAFLTGANDRFEAHLNDHLASVAVPRSKRIEEALDLLLGRRQLYTQAPSSFYFPGLPQRQFYERDEFNWVADFEASTRQLKAELLAIIEQEGDFAPYVQSSPDRPLPANHLRDDASWGALYLLKNGEQVIENADRAPATLAALSGLPQPAITGRSPMALYSKLKPGTHIQPHHGLLNTRLICHLPLIAPEGCALRVGNDTRAWREGEMLIFDDSIEHEAWNRGTSDRIVLLFEIWRPEISDEDRIALTAIFEAISDYGIATEDQG